MTEPSQSIRAVAVEGAFGLDNVNLVQRPIPTPGPRQAVVRMKASSLNFRDLLVATGRYNPKMPLPRVLLSDGAGVVEAVGEGVTRVKPGDRVAGIFMQTWLDGPYADAYGKSALGGAIEGVLAEAVVFDENGLVHLPAHLSFAEGATLPCAGVTAWNALVAQGNLKAGDTVLVQGTGGVSLFALQFARMHGARVIATSSSPAKLERAIAMGASDGIDYRATPDWDKRARQLTGGAGVTHVVEVGGVATLGRSLNAVAGGGYIAVIGVLSGIAGELSIANILHKHLRVQGIYVGSRSMFEAMNRAIEFNRMHPTVDRVFPMSEIRDALRYMESAAHFGKIVIDHES